MSDFDASPPSGSWLLRSYVLAFCGLSLLGCRAGDVFGRRRLLRIGVVVFVLASMLGGLAPNLGLLIVGRLLQGVGAALVAPNALSLIATTFPVGKHRIRAMGVYAAVAGGGPAVGLLFGEVLTNGLNWRWVFLANVPVGLAVLAGTRALIDSERQDGRLAEAGTVTATGALIALLCGVPSNPRLDHWTDGLSLASFAVAGSLFLAFLVIQVRSSRQRMALRLLKNRNRSGSLATVLFVASGTAWAFFWKPGTGDQAGAVYLPFIIGTWGAASVALALVSRFAPRFVAGAGLLVASGGMFWFSKVGNSLDAAHAWPALLFIGVGSGFVFVPMTLGALGGIAYEEAGVASGLLNTAQQLGGALGLAAVSTIYTSRLDDLLLRSVGDSSQPALPADVPLVVGTAIAHAHQVASAAAVGLLLLGLAIVLIAVNVKAQNHHGDGPSPRDRTSSAVS